ncbi:beta-lactamase-like protein [Mycena crocata]|nr:beta-lactamase-like protein [Mycena crocata]
MMRLSCLSLLLLAGKTYASFRDFGIPASSATVDVKAFSVGNLTMNNIAHGFFLPIPPGRDSGLFPVFAFLVEHKSSQKRLMFDLGTRTDFLNLSPASAGLFTSGLLTLETSANDITDLLHEGGIALDSISAVIWSHSHLDHTGDMSKFPNATALIVGPGTVMKTYPEFADAALLASDFAGRNVTQLNIAQMNLTFSGLKAFDYFGDGSFYLLNTPGHEAGHMTALARVTPTSFIVLGGDSFHHAGQARPRPQFQRNYPCPSHLLKETKSSISTDYFWSPNSRDGVFDMRSRAQQLLSVSDVADSLYRDPVKSEVSLAKIATFDADPDFLVVVAHDQTWFGSLPLFPSSINGWKKSGLKERTVWNFADKENIAFRFSPV